ncbi:MAG: hypothetical protein KDB61_04280, partial [Planctomycetes bacterium]|nr:hypothetical protein [Planctomycetota bacterium]
MRLVFLLLLALSAQSCQSSPHRLAFEGRLGRATAEESSFNGGGEPTGGSIAVLSLPFQGANTVGWEFGLGEGKDTLMLVGGDYELRHREAWLGLHYALLDGHWRPYLGAGIQYTQQDVDLTYDRAKMYNRTHDVGPY